MSSFWKQVTRLLLMISLLVAWICFIEICFDCPLFVVGSTIIVILGITVSLLLRYYAQQKRILDFYDLVRQDDTIGTLIREIRSVRDKISYFRKELRLAEVSAQFGCNGAEEQVSDYRYLIVDYENRLQNLCQQASVLVPQRLHVFIR